MTAVGLSAALREKLLLKEPLGAFSQLEDHSEHSTDTVGNLHKDKSVCCGSSWADLKRL